MNDTFQLQLLEDDVIHYSGEAQYCSVQTLTGSIGFEARHEDFAGALAPGSLLMYRDGQGEEKEIRIGWGMLLFRDNRCIVTMAG